MRFSIECLGLVALAGLWILTAPRAEAAEEAVLDIGSRLELFVDRFLIERMEGTALALHAPVEAESVIAFDRPWEGKYVGYVTIIQDGDLFRMYYRGMPEAGTDDSDEPVTCYAESKDGVIWTRPNLSLFEVHGTTENNVILADMPPFSHNFAPFLDTRPGVPADERFKAVAGLQRSGLYAFASGDGVHWRRMQDEPVITEGHLDSQNLAFWSDAEQCYCCYLRLWAEGVRTIGRATSTDFRTWTSPEFMRFGDTPMEHLYTNQTHAYYRAPHIYIATAARFMPKRRVVSVERFEALGGDADYSGDCSDTVLLSSRGGLDYERTFMEGFVRPGMGLSNWTSRTNYPACGIVPTGDGEMSMYIQRHYGQPSHRLQRLTLRTDGFVSVNAPYAGGEMFTKPLRFSGKRLAINFATSAAGSVWVEIQDGKGTPIDGFTLDDADEIIGDEIERTVTWQGTRDLSALAGRTVRLRFVMKDADLYSLAFRP